jgi:hypothetical protein
MLCQRFSVLCFAVSCDGPIPRPRGSTNISKRIHSPRINSESEQARGPKRKQVKHVQTL